MFVDQPRSKAMLMSGVEIFGHARFSDAEPVLICFQVVGCHEENLLTKSLCEWMKKGHNFLAPVGIRGLIAAQDATPKEAVHGA